MNDMDLIANSGIQLFSKKIQIDMKINFKMFFHEWSENKKDNSDEQLKLEIAHCFTDNEVWVKKYELYELGYLTNGEVCDSHGKNYSWDEIVKAEGLSTIDKMKIPVNSNSPIDSGCFSVSTGNFKLKEFENKWLPLPFFSLDNDGESEFGPTNWCRIMLIPVEERVSIEDYYLLIAFDTRAKSIDEDEETPVFENSNEVSKKYALCNDEFLLPKYCSKEERREWIGQYIMSLFDYEKIEQIKSKPTLNYLAQYIFLIRFIQHQKIMPQMTLYSDKQYEYGNVDLVIDIGNSRTCVVLIDQVSANDSEKFKNSSLLELQNFSNPIIKGELNKSRESFDMRLAFSQADFGNFTIVESRQFIFPSMVRLGKEANQLIHNATEFNAASEKITTFSSPKRYLWDDSIYKHEWQFVQLNGESNKTVFIKGITEQIKEDGSLNKDADAIVSTKYSRKTLMTLSFLEIFAQAKMQINSYELRKKWSVETFIRQIGKVIITCPPSMSRVEHITLRKCAEDALIILDRFYSGDYDVEFDEDEARSMVNVVPSVTNLKKNYEKVEWIYDEATCSQFVFLYSAISKLYLNKAKDFFNLYGKKRDDLGDYNKKSLTIGTFDCGAGTTDLMICSYKYEDGDKCKLTPVPLFWESFYHAGDDLLKEIVRQMVIEGESSSIRIKLKELGKSPKEILQLNAGFFGKDDTVESVQNRILRRDFNLQISVPIASYYLELLRKGKEDKKVSFNDIFIDNEPTKQVLDHFRQHFNFDFMMLTWHYDSKKISAIVEKTFDNLVEKVSTIFYYYSCDIVLLSGRPSSLKPLSDLFVKYFSVPANRLISLNNYRVGSWYPYNDKSGYVKDGKSIVAIGAMIGDYASKQGSLNGFSLNVEELAKRIKPTTEYFGVLDGRSLKFNESFISPEINQAKILVTTLPEKSLNGAPHLIRIGCRQLNTASYPSRPLYVFNLDRDKVEKVIREKLEYDADLHMVQAEVERIIDKIRKKMPLTITVERQYIEDKEKLVLTSVVDIEQNDVSLGYFNLHIQSMSETESFWLDTGAFDLSIS